MTTEFQRYADAEAALFRFMALPTHEHGEGKAGHDTIRVIDALYRRRKLLRVHLLVLSHYGRRQSAPDPNVRREAPDHELWRQAMDVLVPAMAERGIIG